MKTTGIFLLILFAALTSCSDRLDFSPYNDNSLLYIPQAYQVSQIREIPSSQTELELEIGAAIGGFESSSKDIMLTFTVDPDKLDSYNEENDTDYLLLPDGLLESLEFKATIEKGKRNTELLAIQLKDIDQLEVNQTYLLPVTLNASAAGIQINEELRTVYYLLRPIYQLFDRQEWSIHDYSSDEDERASGGRAHHALDGNDMTIWATPWRLSKPTPPHHISIDMGSVQTLHGLTLSHRRDPNEPSRIYQQSGSPVNIEVWFSDDGVTWANEERFTLTREVNDTINFSRSHKVRYFRIIVKSTFNNFYQTFLAEINAF